MKNEIVIYFKDGNRKYIPIAHYINIKYDLGVMEIGFTDMTDCLIKPKRLSLEEIECIKVR